MPLSHKIIRCDFNKQDNLTGKHNLALRHDFPVKTNPLIEASQDALPEQQLENIRIQAREILEKANKDAAAILNNAQAEAALEAKKIYSEAARNGYERGYKEAMESAAAEAQEIRNQANLVLEQAENVRKEQLNNLSQEIINLSVEIAEKLVSKHLELKSDAVLDIANEAVQLVSNRQFIVLRVNPDEFEVCNKYQNEILAALPPMAKLQIITDPVIEKGGCVVETDFGKVDSTLSARWENLLAVLKGESD